MIENYRTACVVVHVEFGDRGHVQRVGFSTDPDEAGA